MTVDEELARRERMWQRLLAGSPDRHASTATLETAGIRPANTGQGIFRDIEHTKALAAAGVTLTLLDTGSVYDDAFDDDAGEYHFPRTARGSRDQNEVDATKNARRLRLPVFVVLRGRTESLREVRRGWVESWDDARQVFLVSFSDMPAPTPTEDPEFTLISGMRGRRLATIGSRPGQARFRYSTLLRCGGECAACGLQVEVLLDAAHLCGVEEGGSDDARNGIALCRNHHRAFDRQLFGIDPVSLALVGRASATLTEIGATRAKLTPGRAPHADALAWTWARFLCSFRLARRRGESRCAGADGI